MPAARPPAPIAPPPRHRGARFRGWEIVAACFVMAAITWGFGFYGTGYYLAVLTQERQLPIDGVSAGITGYFWISALLIMSTGRWLDRLGPRRFVTLGVVALVAGVALVAQATSLAGFYVGMAVLTLAWTTMSSSAINTILAPWFRRRRGMAVSLALTGASFGGILIVPLIVALSGPFGVGDGLIVAVLACGLVVLLVAWRSFVREPALIGQAPDGEPAGPAASETPSGPATVVPLGRLLRSRPFLGNALPFALGLTVQVGFLTHQIAMIQPVLGAAGAASAVGLTTASAVGGRLLAGALMDRLSRRALASLNFGIQTLGLLAVAHADAAWAVYLGCALFGAAVGNMITFPGLLIQSEFPAEQFNRVNRLAVGIGQLFYALGPMAMAAWRLQAGDYLWPLQGCALLTALAGVALWLWRPDRAADRESCHADRPAAGPR